MKEIARAKVNLCLEVTEKLPDGYHGVRSLMQSLEFGDTVELEPGDRPWRVRSDLPYLPSDEGNLAAKAALLFRRLTGLGPEGGTIRLTKRIPVCGGFGGGSSDAAAVLRLLNRSCGCPLTWEDLERESLALGADVPFCIRGGNALAEGKGENLTPLPDPEPIPVVVCRPDFLCSTAELFRAYDRQKQRLRPDVPGMVAALRAGDPRGIARRMFNAFESVLSRSQREQVRELKDRLLDEGALGASMTGTGSGVFALFPAEDTASLAVSRLRESGVHATLTRTAPRLTDPAAETV